MRKFVAAAAAALAFSTAAYADASWTYAYVNGVATATQTDDHGRVTATMTCQPPTGDIIIADYALARSAGRANRASVRIGQMTVTVPASVERVGRERALTIHLPQRPPILAAVQPTDVVTVSVNGRDNTYAAGSAHKMGEVAYACWGS